MLLFGFFTPATKAVITAEPPLPAASCHGARRQTRGSFLTQKSAAFAIATMGLSDFHPRPVRVLTDHRLPGLLPLHEEGSPVLTRESFARMSTSLPRRLGPVRMLLASWTNGGLRPFIAGSALTLAVSRPARRSLMFQPACSLSPLSGTFYARGFDPSRYQLEPLRLLPVGATVTGWDTFLPQDSRALFTAHDKAELSAWWESTFHVRVARNRLPDQRAKRT